eukprot:GFUD01045323.1.p1 GENE.GFUD01045323.1~~GFUD01045323.1.p1  ORF type:complete len:266 (-),score=100.42 GFUD01045323.1:389-1165(-)
MEVEEVDSDEWEDDHSVKKTKVYIPTGKPRGRRPGVKNKIKPNNSVKELDSDNDDDMEVEEVDSDEWEDDRSVKKTKVYIPTGKPRGRRPGVNGVNKIKPNNSVEELDSDDDDEEVEEVDSEWEDDRSYKKKKKKTKPNNSGKEYVPVYKQPGGENEKRGAHLRKGKPRGPHVPDNQKVPSKVYIPTGKPRGRRPGVKNKIKPNNSVKELDSDNDDDMEVEEVDSDEWEDDRSVKKTKTKSPPRSIYQLENQEEDDLG